MNHFISILYRFLKKHQFFRNRKYHENRFIYFHVLQSRILADNFLFLSARSHGLFLTCTLLLALNITAVAAPSTYVHNPMDNPKAAKDIIVNDDAVYGFSPSPTSERLHDYADYDWTDANAVSAMRKQREEYHESMKELYQTLEVMKASGCSTEEIARTLCNRRNEIRLESYKDDPVGLEKAKKSNLENYGNENGGTPDFFYEKYGSWDIVIEKSLSSNPGADACLGLYDTYYSTYIIPTDTTATPAEAAPQFYVVQPNDNLSIIAEKVYGDRNLWWKLYDTNKDIISDPNLIRPNQQLAI